MSAELASEQHQALRYLWARHRIAGLEDRAAVLHDASVAEEIARLGLRYSLMTQHTSFVAVDDRVRNHGGKAEGVIQPLPLPAGVSELARGRALPMAKRSLGVTASPTPQAFDAPSSEGLGSALGLGGMGAGGGGVGYRGSFAAKVRGEDPEWELRRKIGRTRAGLEKCAALGAGRGSSTAKLLIELVIDPAGKVKSAKLVRGSAVEEVDACVLAYLRALRLDARGVEVTLRLPLELR